MKVVVLNAGSGSQKCSLFELPVGPLSEEEPAKIGRTLANARDGGTHKR
jgi:hypothetical protein